MSTEITKSNSPVKITPDMTREERIEAIKASIRKKPEIAELDNSALEEQAEEKNNRKKEKAEEAKQAKEAAKLAKSKAIKQQKEKKEIYKILYKNDTLLYTLHQREAKRLNKNIIINSFIVLLAVASTIVASIFTNINLLVLASIPFLVFNGLKIFKNILEKKSFKNPYELQRILLKRKSEEELKKVDKKIIDNYKNEKKRIKKMKKMPYKILANISFMLSMFTIIFFYFVIEVRVPTMLILLFVAFTISYFLVGIIMTTIAYLISENKLREQKIKLEEEKKRLLIEEKIKSEEALRKKLELERRKYQEEEELKLAEEMRISVEIEKERQKRLEEQKLFEVTAKRKESILEKSRFAKAGLQAKNSDDIKAESNKIKEQISSELFDEAHNIASYNLGGIEDFYRQPVDEIFNQTNDANRGTTDEEFVLDEIENTLPTGSAFGTENITEKSRMFVTNTSKEPEKKLDTKDLKSKNIPVPIMPPAPLPGEKEAKSVNPKSVSLIKEMLKT